MTMMAKDEYCIFCQKDHPRGLDECLKYDISSIKDNSDEVIDYPDIDFDDLLNKYGPEGLYDIADKLIKMADKDMYDAIN